MDAGYDRADQFLPLHPEIGVQEKMVARRRSIEDGRGYIAVTGQVGNKTLLDE
jgi:hypothetical protein